MRVQEIMKTQVVTADVEAPTAVVAQRMLEADVGCVVVMNGQTLVGIVTDRDLATRCLGGRHSGELCPVGHHMSSPVLTLRPDTEVLEAVHELTAKQVKRMPVVEDGKLVGLVSFSDLAEALDRPVHDLMIAMGAVRRIY